jgi:hypothetical protein
MTTYHVREPLSGGCKTVCQAAVRAALAARSTNRRTLGVRHDAAVRSPRPVTRALDEPSSAELARRRAESGEARDRVRATYRGAGLPGATVACLVGMGLTLSEAHGASYDVLADRLSAGSIAKLRAALPTMERACR